jgi:hypothetical protein
MVGLVVIAQMPAEKVGVAQVGTQAVVAKGDSAMGLRPRRLVLVVVLGVVGETHLALGPGVAEVSESLGKGLVARRETPPMGQVLLDRVGTTPLQGTQLTLPLPPAEILVVVVAFIK